MDYAPEFTSMARPDDDKAQLQVLKERYGAEAQALSDVLLLAPAGQLAATAAEAFLHAGEGTRSAKLVYSVRSVEEFSEPGSEFDAHLTVLIDAFGDFGRNLIGCSAGHLTLGEAGLVSWSGGGPGWNVPVAPSGVKWAISSAYTLPASSTGAALRAIASGSLASCQRAKWSAGGLG
ncbi:hypothetical protein [Streptomyces sp. NPDC102282]|uniref:hypothetical protein n=1 Tax=Streptomyces sp. NPDC102282 TaxID=3366154 RepID=UPI003811E955